MSFEYMTLCQFAKKVGCTRQVVSRMVRDGLLPTIAIGKRQRIDIERFDQMRAESSFINNQKVRGDRDAQKAL